MDRQFVFLNFHTEYSSKGTLNKGMAREYCFGDVFYNDAKQNNVYKIIIYKQLNGVNDGAKNNACFLTKDELLNHITVAKRVHDFDLSIEEKDTKFIVHLTLDAPRIIHRYILTWLRYSYEYPFNMYLHDAMKLNKTIGFKRDDIFNLFNLVGATSGFHFHGDRIHCIGDATWPRKFYTKKEQVEIVHKAKATSEVNDLFPPVIGVVIDTFIDNEPNYAEDMESLEYWTDDKLFNKRLKYYKHNKKVIDYFLKNKKHEKEN